MSRFQPGPGVRAVLFDVDGTLQDSMPMIVAGLGDMFEKYNGVRPTEPEIRSLIGMPLKEQVHCFTQEARSPALVQEMIDYTIDRFHAQDHLSTPYPAAVQALRECHEARLKTALVTSKNRRELDHFLPRFSGAAWADVAICSSDVARPKPYGDSALLALKKLGVAAHEAVFIGDAIYDIHCARDAGVPVVAVSYGACPRATLEAEAPEELLDQPEELLEWVRANLIHIHAA